MSGRIVLALGGLAAGLVLAAPAAANETITYTYDAKGRLVTVVHSGSVNNNVQAVYGYDPADNRTNVTVTGATGSDGGGGGASVPPTAAYKTRYVYNGRFFVSIIRQEL